MPWHDCADDKDFLGESLLLVVSRELGLVGHHQYGAIYNNTIKTLRSHQDSLVGRPKPNNDSKIIWLTFTPMRQALKQPISDWSLA